MSESVIPGTALNGQANFNVKHEYRDFFSDVQNNMRRIGDVGKESDEFKDSAYSQFKNHDFNKLAELQDEFVTEDPLYGTPGREKNRNYNRMEYDYNKRFDGKSKEDVMKEVNKKTELNVNNILDALKNPEWTVNTLSVAIGSSPITQKDYENVSRKKI